MKRILLIDADVLVHKVSRAAEHKVRWPNGVWTWFADEAETLIILDNYMTALYKNLDTDVCVMCLSSDTNFRKEVFADYKAHRNNSDSYEPMMKQFLRQHFQDNYESFLIDDLEADDVLGILMTTDGYKSNYEKVLCTIDKDLDTIPGVHWNLDKKVVYDVTMAEADRKFYQQMLTGDRVDNIPGLPGYGEKTADKVLDKHPPVKWYDEIVKIYIAKGYDEDYAITMARLVRILRAEDWDFETKTLRLWNYNRDK
jgi:DNA polymerase-1